MSQSVRKHRRYLVPAECVVRNGERLYSDAVVDASYDGLRVRTLRRPSVGEPVRISLCVPGSRVWLEAEGTVTRVLEGRRSGEDGPSFAIQLRRMDGMHRLLLSTVASCYPETSGTRGTRRDYASAVERIGRRGESDPET